MDGFWIHLGHLQRCWNALSPSTGPLVPIHQQQRAHRGRRGHQAPPNPRSGFSSDDFCVSGFRNEKKRAPIFSLFRGKTRVFLNYTRFFWGGFLIRYSIIRIPIKQPGIMESRRVFSSWLRWICNVFLHEPNSSAPENRQTPQKEIHLPTPQCFRCKLLFSGRVGFLSWWFFSQFFQLDFPGGFFPH